MPHAFQCISTAAKCHIYRLESHLSFGPDNVITRIQIVSWSAQMSLSVIFNRFPLRVLSRQPSWGLDPVVLPALSVCVCVSPQCIPPEKPGACTRAHLKRVLPFTASWLSKLIPLWDFLVICEPAVTVMRAAQRRRRRGKCQRVSEDWHGTSELSTRGPSASTQHTHDKAQVVQTRIIPFASIEEGITRAHARMQVEGETRLLVLPARRDVQKERVSRRFTGAKWTGDSPVLDRNRRRLAGQARVQNK